MGSCLTVFLGQEKVGILTQPRRGAMQFTYHKSWLEENPDAIPLSRSLPLRSEPFPTNRTRPFFAGLLPEAAPRREIAAILGVSEGNHFGLLERIGGECAGAVSLFPEASPPSEGEGEEIRKLTEVEIRQIVETLAHRPLLAGREGLRLSLAGAQDKLPVIFAHGRFSLPMGNTPSTHILKPQPERFPGLAGNEFFCMKLAAAVGLNVADIQYRSMGRKPCVIVRRYDRRANASGLIQRLHQEDFCQALGLPPERKYQGEGGPTITAGIRLLREWSTVPVKDIRDFLDGLIFNVIIGNADAHGKNYSMLYDGEQRRLAPLYDLVCTLAWPELSKGLAMRVGSARHINEINDGHWRKMSAKAGLSWPMVRDRVNELSEYVRQSLPGVSEETIEAGVEETVIGQWVDIISERCALRLEG